jgi:hypothetical protein
MNSSVSAVATLKICEIMNNIRRLIKSLMAYRSLFLLVKRQSLFETTRRRKTMKNLFRGLILGAAVLTFVGCSSHYTLAPEEESLMREAIAASQASKASADQAAASATKAESAAARAESAATRAESAAGKAAASAAAAEDSADKAAKAFEMSLKK